MPGHNNVNKLFSDNNNEDKHGNRWTRAREFLRGKRFGRRVVASPSSVESVTSDNSSNDDDRDISFFTSSPKQEGAALAAESMMVVVDNNDDSYHTNNYNVPWLLPQQLAQ